MNRVIRVLLATMSGAAIVLALAPSAVADVPLPTPDGHVPLFNTGYANSYPSIDASNPNWLSRISNSTPLNRISIPGTHDSGTASVTSNSVPQFLYRDQSLSITDQLNAGIRFLDIRLQCEVSRNPPLIGKPKYDLVIFHGNVAGDPIDSNTEDLTSVVNDVNQFLARNSSETVIMQISKFGATSSRGWGSCYNRVTNFPKSLSPGIRAVPQSVKNAGYSFGAVFADTWQRIASQFWSAPSCGPVPIPTLGAVRGKIVMEQAFNSVTTCPGNGQVNYGLEDNGATHYSDPTAYANAGFGCTVQPGLVKVNNYMLPNLAYARTNADSGMVVTWTQMSSGGPSCGPALTSPSYVNAYVTNELISAALQRGSGTVGIVAMDFPGASLINQIISLNQFTLSSQHKTH